MSKLSDTAAGFEQTTEKICRACGKNLKGHRRIRDGDTYICPVCDQMEREGQMPEGLPCAECGRTVKPTALRRYGDISLCPKCYTDHMQDTKRRPRRIADHTWKFEEKRNIAILAAIAGVLLLIILFSWLAS